VPSTIQTPRACVDCWQSRACIATSLRLPAASHACAKFSGPQYRPARLSKLVCSDHRRGWCANSLGLSQVPRRLSYRDCAFVTSRSPQPRFRPHLVDAPQSIFDWRLSQHCNKLNSITLVHCALIYLLFSSSSSSDCRPVIHQILINTLCITL